MASHQSTNPLICGRRCPYCYDGCMDEGALERICGGEAADEMTILAALRQEIRRLDPSAQIEVSGEAGREKLRIGRTPDEAGEVSLHNLWRKLRNVGGEEAAQAIERFASACAHDFSELESAAQEASVMPMILNRARVEALGSEGSEPFCRQFSTCGTLYVCLVFDAPDHVRYLSFSELADCGLGEPEGAEGEAIANLASHVSAGGSPGVESRPALPERETPIAFLQDYRDVIVHRIQDRRMESAGPGPWRRGGG